MAAERRPGTRVVHAGLPPAAPGTPFLAGPVFAAPFHLPGDPRQTPYAYARSANPTWAAYEQALASSIDELVAVAPDARVALVTVPCMHEVDPRLGGPGSPRNDPDGLRWINQRTAEVARRYGGRAMVVDMGPLVCPGGRPLDEVDGVVARADGVRCLAVATGPFAAEDLHGADGVAADAGELRELLDHDPALRDALLPRLISGDLRVKDAETFLDRVL